METQSANGGGGRKGRNAAKSASASHSNPPPHLRSPLVLGLTLFKPKRPITTIDSVAVDRRPQPDAHRRSLPEKPNRVGFSFGNSSALLNYGGKLIGEAPIPASRIGPEKTLPMNLTLTLMADRLLTDTQLIGDVTSGSIPVNTFVRVAGKVSVLKIFKIKVQSSSSCDIVISVANRNVTSQHCKYSTKL
ncbi:hypothetical protein Bca52824_000210 [Brassica carinata]|uniref:Late embryogenesis abundant protein LEA-2 subgroup domain-containing protein n=1 Tax=Brassica carinata TaxID=52824 RepID=A0A8X7WGY8_BRACI|nr:hypothetical protein Bca52824_000210 [Brassica carinata]